MGFSFQFNLKPPSVCQVIFQSSVLNIIAGISRDIIEENIPLLQSKRTKVIEIGNNQRSYKNLPRRKKWFWLSFYIKEIKNLELEQNDNTTN